MPAKSTAAPKTHSAKTPHAKAPLAKAAKASPATTIAAGAVTPTIQRNEGDTNAAPITPKNFRNHPDMENFFRFIYENDLRHEALQIIDEIIANRATRRSKKAPAGARAAALANA